MKRRMFGAANSRRVPKSMVRAYTIKQVAVTNRSGSPSVRNGHFLARAFQNGTKGKADAFPSDGPAPWVKPVEIWA